MKKKWLEFRKSVNFSVLAFLGCYLVITLRILVGSIASATVFSSTACLFIPKLHSRSQLLAVLLTSYKVCAEICTVVLIVFMILWFLYVLALYGVITVQKAPILALLVNLAVLTCNLYYMNARKKRYMRQTNRWSKALNKTMRDVGYEGDWVTFDKSTGRIHCTYHNPEEDCKSE